MLTAILTGVLVFLGNILILLIVKRQLDRQKSDIFMSLSSYFTRKEKETPSDFELQAEAIAQLFASRTANSIKTTVMGMNSVQSKNNAKLDQALSSDLIGIQNPLLGFLSQLPQTRSLLKKQPGILDFAMSVMNKNKIPGDNGKEEILIQENM